MATTRLSTKEQLITPKDIRERHGWDSGTELELENRGDSVVIRPVLGVPRTKLNDLIGCLRYEGTPKTLEEMEKHREGRPPARVIGLDTNVVVRALTQDEPTQAKRVAAISSSDALGIAKTPATRETCVEARPPVAAATPRSRSTSCPRAAPSTSTSRSFESVSRRTRRGPGSSAPCTV